MKKISVGLLICSLIFMFCLPIYKGVYANSHTFESKKYRGISTNYVIINMNDKNIKPVLINAQNKITKTDSFSNMTKYYKNVFAAINGTYFDAYGSVKYPIPYGTLIKDNNVLHISKGPVAAITKDNKLVVDRLSFKITGYINDKIGFYPWRINHPSPEADAIAIYTQEYGAKVDVVNGGKAVIIENSKVKKIVSSSIDIPKNSYVLLFNSNVAYLSKRFSVGDTVRYETDINTTFTKKQDWEEVSVALGAGPSLVINGKITADGAIEGFVENKINVDAGTRSFIGSTKDNRIFIGTFNSATLKTAAQICKDMGLVNAMCLDGGGSTSLYYNGSIKASGRNLNNVLAFVKVDKK